MSVPELRRIEEGPVFTGRLSRVDRWMMRRTEVFVGELLLVRTVFIEVWEQQQTTFSCKCRLKYVNSYETISG
jgi:hypothetical protein